MILEIKPLTTEAFEKEAVEKSLALVKKIKWRTRPSIFLSVYLSVKN